MTIRTDTALHFGQIIMLENGEYSDRTWNGPYIVERPFDIAERMEYVRRHWPEVKGEVEIYRDTPDAYFFIGWLIKEGYITTDLHCTSFHIGSYGDLALS